MAVGAEIMEQGMKNKANSVQRSFWAKLLINQNKSKLWKLTLFIHFNFQTIQKTNFKIIQKVLSSKIGFGNLSICKLRQAFDYKLVRSKLS